MIFRTTTSMALMALLIGCGGGTTGDGAGDDGALTTTPELTAESPSDTASAPELGPATSQAANETVQPAPTQNPVIEPVAAPESTTDGLSTELDSETVDVLIIDADGDSVADENDNCPSHINYSQTDFDGDGFGDVCDDTPRGPDYDSDGITDEYDNCISDPNETQTDSDWDGIGDVCDPTPLPNDDDFDGFENDVDNCPLVKNTTQADEDFDGIGNACDADYDANRCLGNGGYDAGQAIITNESWGDNCQFDDIYDFSKSGYSAGIQTVLYCTGYLSAKPKATLGTSVFSALFDYQIANGLVVDGILGPQTWTALQSELIEERTTPDSWIQYSVGTCAEDEYGFQFKNVEQENEWQVRVNGVLNSFSTSEGIIFDPADVPLTLPPPSGNYPEGTLTALIEANGGSSALAQLKAAGLDLALNDPFNTWTIFLPTDSAIAAFAGDENPMPYFYTNAALSSVELVGLSGTAIMTQTGTALLAGGGVQPLTIDGHSVVTTDLRVGEFGTVVHMLDGVLVP